MTTETVVCFDLDGTLVHFDREYGRILRAAFEQHVADPDEDALDAYDEAFYAAFDALEERPYHAGVAAAAERLETDGLDHDEVVATIREAEFAAATVPDAVPDCLAEFAADDDAVLAVVTDGVGDWQRAKLAHVGLAEFFDETFISYEVGGHKESGAPYDAVRERFDAEEYVMVGDDYDADVQAAREAGFVPVQYEDAESDLFSILRAML